ncbi:glycoside hydrolase family protein [Lignipirellula cremea]|uniref:Glycosyl hydrolase family 32 N-terminal domain-containing protein n=1 Tax=Lignipirellula cremea TaxID=2528010 RepID=A0A518DLT8_9BACT|nr:hypothetical protein [Lignipirellula cremea]QDU92806.1 hypothetical protein Pla8534_05790 [Lignipirellula cremea]
MPSFQLSRRAWLQSAAATTAGALLVSSRALAEEKTAVVDIGTRRELFVDDLLIGQLQGVVQKLHEPQRLRTPSSRPSGHYATVLKDGDKYRMYYRGDKVPGLHWRDDGWGEYHANEITKYAESKDGFHWTQPDLGLYDIKGVPAGNTVLSDAFLVTHNFSPFIDDNPAAPADQRYKALGGGRYPEANWGVWKMPNERAELRKKYGPGGLYAWGSPDGLHWKKLREAAVIPEDAGNFDSQNVAFWSAAEGQYVSYFRWSGNGQRSIRRATSPDFLHWSDPVDMRANEPGEHLYTSGTHPYFRAPHIYIALPTRFQTRRNAITDVAFMTTRPGSDHYDRTFKEAFIRPGLGPGGWGNRSNYIAWHVVPTSDTEMSMYMYGGAQYVLRYDGFISIHAGFEQGEFLTKPLKFDGDKLEVNYSTSAAGGIHVEIQDLQGQPIPGFALADSDLLYGDAISHHVAWQGKTDVRRLAGRPVRLRFVMNEADLYSLRFQ